MEGRLMTQKFIDLRSDTVTRPTESMRRVIASAEVGDDVFGEDPTVNRLQETVAGILGKEAALFVPSGTMGNQISIKVFTRPGDEIIAERGSHVFNYETAGAAFLSSVQVHCIQGTRGVMDLASVRAAVRPALYYMPRTRLVCIENTHNRAGGTIQPLERMREIAGFARENGISVHLDGARLWNASVATGVPPAEYASLCDSVSVCLSKGLGAPVGSVIAGTREFIEEALHYRKIFGGGMRQAGILAAAGLYALEHHRERLAEDHEKAKELSRVLCAIPDVVLDVETVQTNIVIFSVERDRLTPAALQAQLKQKGVLVSSGAGSSLRAVTHLDVPMADVLNAARVFEEVLGGG
jgi:threonine aldolase